MLTKSPPFIFTDLEYISAVGYTDGTIKLTANTAHFVVPSQIPGPLFEVFGEGVEQLINTGDKTLKNYIVGYAPTGTELVQDPLEAEKPEEPGEGEGGSQETEDEKSSGLAA